VLGYLYWNPKREIFTFLNLSIYWYSIFFIIGFILGYYIFFYLLKKYFLNFPFVESDIKDFVLLKDKLKKNFFEKKNKEDKKNILKKINDRFFDKNNFKKRLIFENNFLGAIEGVKEKSRFIADKVCLYVVIATILGARLGHVIFYDFLFFVSHPLEIFKIWRGGLASHGGAICIIFFLFLLSKKIKKRYPLTFINFLDLISVPAALVASLIRIGNFVNQEILGKKTFFFLGVIFGALKEDFPRHPVQLYESLFYFFVFIILFYLSVKKNFFLKKGKLIGIFLVSVFSFRFLIEFLKIKQSFYLENSFFLMGQYLSIPFIILGLFFLYQSKRKSILPKS